MFYNIINYWILSLYAFIIWSKLFHHMWRTVMRKEKISERRNSSVILRVTGQVMTWCGGLTRSSCPKVTAGVQRSRCNNFLLRPELKDYILPPPDVEKVKARSNRGEEVGQFSLGRGEHTWRLSEGGDEVGVFISPGSSMSFGNILTFTRLHNILLAVRREK